MSAKEDTQLPEAMSAESRLYLGDWSLTELDEWADDHIKDISKFPDAPQAPVFHKMLIERQVKRHIDRYESFLATKYEFIIPEVDAGVKRVYGQVLEQMRRAEPALGAEAVTHLGTLLKGTKRTLTAERKKAIAEAGAALLKRTTDADLRTKISAGLEAINELKSP